MCINQNSQCFIYRHSSLLNAASVWHGRHKRRLGQPYTAIRDVRCYSPPGRQPGRLTALHTHSPDGTPIPSCVSVAEVRWTQNPGHAHTNAVSLSVQSKTGHSSHGLQTGEQAHSLVQPHDGAPLAITRAKVLLQQSSLSGTETSRTSDTRIIHVHNSLISK